MSGIGPLSKAYESFVLPLNYTGVIDRSDIYLTGMSPADLVAGPGIEPGS